MHSSNTLVALALSGLLVGGAPALVTGCSSAVGPAGPGGVDSVTDASHGDDGRPGTMPPPGNMGDAGGVGPAPDAGADGAMAMETGSPPDGGSDATINPDAGPPGMWSSFSYGMSTMDTGSGNNILIAYGGYTATDQDSQAWAMQLYNVSLAQLGVGHLYAARGPADPEYTGREIGNSEVAARLLTQATPATYVIVIAHSSGAFVADELFTFADPTVLAKLAYFDLDGGSWALTDALVGSMKAVTFCNADDSVAGRSHNADAIDSLHTMFAASRIFTVNADGSGCNVGASWCMHDTLIINHPHNPDNFDLDLDYTDFTGGRQLTKSYIDQAVSDGIL